jgi:signal transduction histidine kinase
MATSDLNDHDEPTEEEAQEYLRMQYNELAELAGSLAHEIKNPLSVIRMNVELLAEDFDEMDTPETRRATRKIEVVKKQCIRLEGLLNEFLRFTRLNRLQLVPGSLNRQVEQVLDFYEAEAEERGIQIVRYLNPDLPSIRMDKSTLEAALVNLVKNALESMPAGGEFMARTRMTRNGVALDLIDTGVGMEEEALLKMFEAFYTTKEGGSGLGLPMAKRIIEAHGGFIRVQSDKGQGTQFTLEFPSLPQIPANTSAAPPSE